MKRRARKILREITLWLSILIITVPLSFVLLPSKTAFATAPSVQGTATCTQDTSSTSFTVTLPSGIVAGELLLLFMAATTTGAITQSGGSTTFNDITFAANGTAVHGEVWAAIASGSDTNPTFTQTTSDDVAVVAIRVDSHGVSDVSTDIYFATHATGSNGSPNPPSLTPGGGQRDYLWLPYFAADDDDNAATWWPTDYTAVNQCESAQSTTSSMAGVAYRQLNALTQDPGTFTMAASEEWVSNTIAIRPAPTYSQAAFRFYEDGTESGSTPIAAQDIDISRNVDSNSNLHLRTRIDESNGGFGASTDDWQLQYSKNGGAYTNVTTTSSNVQGFNSSLTDGGATTDRATDGISNASGTFDAGEISEDGLIDDDKLDGASGATPLVNYTEQLFTLTLIAADLANSDTLDFRILYKGSTITYSQTPTITATKTATGPTTDQVMRHGNWFDAGVEQRFFWAD